MTGSEQVRHSCDSNKQQITLSFVATLGYKIDENTLKSCAVGRHNMPQPLQVDL